MFTYSLPLLSYVPQYTSPAPTSGLQKYDLVRVVATVLHPEIYYKTIPITGLVAFTLCSTVADPYNVVSTQNPICVYNGSRLVVVKV